MAKIGDIVRFLNSVGGGRVVRIEGNLAHVEDNDGFEIPVLLKECVVVDSNPVQEHHQNGNSKRETTQQSPAVAIAADSNTKIDSEEDVTETESGDTINLVLGYEPQELKHLNTTAFDTYLVNDSNYYMYFCYMTRDDNDSGWTTRYAGIVEPNIQVRIDTVTNDMLAHIDHIAIQYIAFKQDKEYTLKNPALVEYSFDATRFFKLHCFHENPYFDIPVIAYDIVKNDRPMRQHTVDSNKLEKALRQKKNIDRKPVVKRSLKKADKRNGDVIEVDLHINELIDNTNGLSSADMLNLQIDEFRRIMDENLKHQGQKIVFIHGKGEGVLRNAIMKELNHRYKGHQVQDASFREYGYGATQVTI